MKKYLFISFFLLLLAIVVLVNLPGPTFSTSNTFLGYPCLDNCQGFKTGFETARDQKFTENARCEELPASQKLGCLSYMHEYDLGHNLPQGYVFPVGHN